MNPILLNYSGDKICNNLSSTYIKKMRNIGVVSKSKNKIYTLKFDPVFSHADLNIDKRCCCYCGLFDNITSHHIIPRVIWKNLPDATKCVFGINNCINICRQCHDELERYIDHHPISFLIGDYHNLYHLFDSFQSFIFRYETPKYLQICDIPYLAMHSVPYTIQCS